MEKDQTVFRTIQLSSPDMNGLNEEWRLIVEADGAVKGTLQWKASGLSDYSLRQSLKRSSPQQTNYLVQRMINRRSTGLSVQTVETSALADLSTPLQITIHCSGPNWRLVRSSLTAPYNLWDAVAVQGRDRDVLLNDGQPLLISQTIRIQGDPTAPTAMKWEKTTDLASMDVVYESSAAGWERRSQLNLTQPRIPSEAYATFQAQVSEWNAALTHHLTDNEEGAE
jgi:hypothetical protein